MFALQQRLRPLVDAWRAAGYPAGAYGSIGDILEFARDPAGGPPGTFVLRPPQLRALETYWFLRLRAGGLPDPDDPDGDTDGDADPDASPATPRVADLYGRVFGAAEILDALGVPADAPAVRQVLMRRGAAGVLDRLRDDADFADALRLGAVHETLTLAYPSYIFALAMGAGKTALIGAIIATEFAMAQAHPGGPFVRNALVFAPGTTILGSLRELNRLPYARILPPELCAGFLASLKLTFTREGEQELPVQRGSFYNVIVTNTERIRIQKEAVRRKDLGKSAQLLLAPDQQDAARADVANRRLQVIASLPDLAVFSDEAHHTYGGTGASKGTVDARLKRVRQTVNYLAARTTLAVVVNTTGTPFFERQRLRDVVAWYGLAEGIRDGILKPVERVRGYDLRDNVEAFVEAAVSEFLAEYRDVRLPNGALAKLAVYFPQTEDVHACRPAVDRALAAAGLPPDVVVVNTSDKTLTGEADLRAFRDLDAPTSPHRVVLLVNKGAEGWNCVSLFACALARTLKRSNNFVLQAATRCLRRVAGAPRGARLFLSRENARILDEQLQKTYGDSLEALQRPPTTTAPLRLTLRHPTPAPLRLRRTKRTYERAPAPSAARPLVLRLPDDAAPAAIGTATTYGLASGDGRGAVLVARGPAETLRERAAPLGVYEAAVDLSGAYGVDPWAVYDELRRLYGDAVPAAHRDPLAEQIEAHLGPYTVRETVEEVALALVRPDGFTRVSEAGGPGGPPVYVTEIVYPVGQERLLRRVEAATGSAVDATFHYSPYNFDSMPEVTFFDLVLRELNIPPDDVEDFLYTGAITDPAKTDFFVWYRDAANVWRRYTPDFVVRRKPAPGAPGGSGRVLIVEIKAARQRDVVEAELARFAADGTEPVSVDGRKAAAVRRLERLSAGDLRYEIIFEDDAVTYDQAEAVLHFAQGAEAGPAIGAGAGTPAGMTQDTTR